MKILTIETFIILFYIHHNFSINNFEYSWKQAQMDIKLCLMDRLRALSVFYVQLLFIQFFTLGIFEYKKIKIF